MDDYYNYANSGFSQGQGFGDQDEVSTAPLGVEGIYDEGSRDRERGGGDGLRDGGNRRRGNGDRRRGGGGRGRGRRPQTSGGGGSFGAKSQQVSKRDVQDGKRNVHLTKLLACWQKFIHTFAYCGNPVTTIECSILNSKLRSIKISFISRQLTRGRNYHIFTGSVFFHKSHEDPEDGIFLAYGLGKNKKTAKNDAYQRAYNIVMNGTIAEINSQEDASVHTLVQDLMPMFNDDGYGYLQFIEQCNIEGEEGIKALILPRKNRPAAGDSTPNFPPEQERMSEDVTSPRMSEEVASLTSPAPENQRSVVVAKAHPLFAKLTQLKKLLKEKGITKLHIIPKIDQFGNSIGLDIKNVFRFSRPPFIGKESETPVFCEIYFDSLLMSVGVDSVKPIIAMHSAYTRLAERLCKERLTSIVNFSRYWGERMGLDHSVCKVICKQKQSGEDDNSLPTNNLADIQRMMQTNPDISKSIDQFVVFEFEADKQVGNSYRILQESASRNCMLLECVVVGNNDQGFTCMISIQGKPLSIRTSDSKREAKRLAGDAILAMMNRTKDIVFVGKDVQGPLFTKTRLLDEAKRAKEIGLEPLKCNLKRDHGTAPPLKTSEQEARLEQSRRIAEGIDNRPENLVDCDLTPWMGRVLADHILDYQKRFSLEDFQFRLQDMPTSMKDVVFNVSSRFGLNIASGKDAILRCYLPALEVTKILGMNNGESGRFRLKQCKNLWSAKELEDYKNEVIAKYTKMYEDLLNNTDAETELEVEAQMEYDSRYSETGL